MPSRLFGAWLIVSHAVAGLGVLSLPCPLTVKGCSLVLLLAHAYRRRPAPGELLSRNRSGFWALPESGLTGLRLGPATRHGRWWVELELIGAGGAQRRLLCRDQLSAAQWRCLQRSLSGPAAARDLS